MQMIAARDFTHFDRRYHKGDEIEDTDPLVDLAPHLFVQPDPEPAAKPRSRRIRGPLVDVDESHGPDVEEEEQSAEPAQPQHAEPATKKGRA